MIADRLAHPEWLTPLATLVAAAVVALLASRARARRHRRALLGVAGRAPRAFQSDAALVLALAAIAAALLGPRLGERVLRVPARGVDVVFLVDVSRSMDASDVPPSRLDRARRAVEEIAGRLQPQDRAALAAFGSRGVLLAPLTPDRDALVAFVAALDTDTIRPAGSHLGDGVRAALTAFAPGSDRPRAVFVLSDGEDAGRSRDLAAAAAREDVRILAAALGSDVGAPVPDHGVPLRDAAGQVVISRRDTARLARLAESTDGRVFAADAWGTFDFDAATAAIRRDAGAAPGEWVERHVPAVRVAPFAALAFALLCLEGLALPLRVRGWRAPVALRGLRPRRLGAAAAAGLALLPAAPARAPAADGERAGAPALEARLRTAPGDARLLVALGLARFAGGETDAAARAFTAAALLARDPHVASVAYYDLGVAAIANGDLASARDAFFDALALAPGNARARFNLEWTLRALDARPPPESPPAPPKPDATARAEVEPSTPKAGPHPADRSEPGEAPALTLDEATRRRMLARVADDPAQSLRAAARAGRDERHRAGPVW